MINYGEQVNKTLATSSVDAKQRLSEVEIAKLRLVLESNLVPDQTAEPNV